MSTLVEVEVVEDLAEEGGVSSGKFEYASFHFSEEVRDGLLGDLRVLFFGYLPGRFHHADEVLVRRSAHGQVSVVVAELLHGDTCVVVSFSSFEVVKEVSEDFVSGLASFKEFGVHGDIVDSGDIVDFNLAGSILIEHGKGLHDHSLSSLSELISQSTDEFFITDVTITIDIIVLHQGLEFNLLGEKSEGGKSLFELSNIEDLVSIEVHSLEDNVERANTNSTALLDSELEFKVQLTDHNIHVNTVESHV